MRKLNIEELNRISTEEFKKVPKTPVIVILDNVRSLNNVGSVFRTCDAFLISKIYLCGITATPPHKEINKTALGATESVDWEYSDDTLKIIRQVKIDNYRVISAEQTDMSTDLKELNIKAGEKIALVLGHEIRGVDQAVIDLSDECVEIPQYGTKHSLNISVSAGIILWEIVKKMSW